MYIYIIMYTLLAVILRSLLSCVIQVGTDCYLTKIKREKAGEVKKKNEKPATKLLLLEALKRRRRAVMGESTQKKVPFYEYRPLQVNTGSDQTASSSCIGKPHASLDIITRLGENFACKQSK